jgi:uncharacterized protein with FMN-binding domain
MEPQKKSTRTIGVIIGAVVILALGGTMFFLENQPIDSMSAQPNNPAVPVTEAVSTQSVPRDTTKKSMLVYKDGTYSATGSYMSPGGEDQIAISLTLTNDIITDVTATNMAGDHTSARFEDKFISGYKQYVVGKKISDVHLTKVSGSSLTPAGFNDALAQIKSQAKA